MMGRGRTPGPSSPRGSRGGRGAKTGRGELNIHTATPSEEAWLFRTGSSGIPWHSAGRPGLCNTAGRTQTLGKGAPGAYRADSRRQSHSRQATAAGPEGRRQAVRWGPWGGARVSLLRPRGGPAGVGEPCPQGQAGGRGPHSTLQQLMQPFWEP